MHAIQNATNSKEPPITSVRTWIDIIVFKCWIDSLSSWLAWKYSSDGPPGIQEKNEEENQTLYGGFLLNRILDSAATYTLTSPWLSIFQSTGLMDLPKSLLAMVHGGRARELPWNHHA